MQLQKREKQAKKGIKIQVLLADNVNNIFERNLNSFLDLHTKNGVPSLTIAVPFSVSCFCRLRLYLLLFSPVPHPRCFVNSCKIEEAEPKFTF